MTTARLLCALFALAAAGCAHRFEPSETEGFHRRELTVEGRAEKYVVYTPHDWAPDKSWPVILYLHGGGEVGSDGVSQLWSGLGPHVHATHGNFPFVVIFPQCPQGSFWAYAGETRRVLAILDQALTDFHGDPGRVYLTGNSMGGYGTWLIGGKHIDRFAALVPICGGVGARGRKLPPDAPYGNVADPYEAVARDIGKTPVWAFHGADDWLVPPSETRHMGEALHHLGNEARVTIYPGVGHDSWDQAYADPALWQWLAIQAKPIVTR